ncbi:right-handed parallel beta-helix repeat-containing protein [Paenisporosarcina antarctica]|uniref:Right handed beta helix domain-containing protein n=1 Tax=Paenisporosarcina antarctica TaxID=417367 RepID=A0A4P6ZYX7_9BACL|nr:right-handed parallel beta-helix repeat-containing protein [Paenisporosarcina antarctica]QBP41930.1 hypothetical protein E2636_12555 [Paenisporosarcina antarctica]
MEMKNIFNILVDIKEARSIIQPIVTQNDSVVFILEVMENGVPFDLTGATTVSLANTRRDNNVVLTQGTKVGNKATFILNSSETAIAGSVVAMAQFYDVNGRVSTLSFPYQVVVDPTGNGYIPSENEATLIEIVLNDGPLIIQSAEDAAIYANEQGDYALQVATDNETRYLNAVSSVASRNSAYPNPSHGDTVRVTNISTSFRYVLGTGWVVTDVYNPTVIDNINQQLAQVSKLGEVIDLSKWGIKNDGTNARATTDGINNALQWYSSNDYRHVLLPSGTFLIDSVNESGTAKSRNIDTGIKIPSNMIFEMSSDTILKVESNASASYACIYLSKTQNNITIIGGQIHGDRKTHDYTGDPTHSTHEYGFGIYLYGASDIIIDRVTIKELTGDGIILFSPGLINYDVNNPYAPPSRIRISGCVIDSSRRNNISITACDQVIVENCQILNAGINDGIHDGTAPRYGIDLEGYGEGSIDYETPLKIIIRNNKLVGNVNTSVGNFNGYEVVITENFSDNIISYGFGTDTIISNNVFKRIDNLKIAIGSLGVSEGKDGNHVTITGNTINGFNVGVDIRGKNVTVMGNNISNVNTSILCFQAEEVLISGNIAWKCAVDAVKILQSKFVSLIGNSLRDTLFGVRIEQSSTNIIINNNSVDEYGTGMKITGGSCTIKGNTFNQGNYTTKSYHLIFDTNVVVLIENNVFKRPGSYVIFGTGGSGTGRARIIKNVIEDFTGSSPVFFSTIGKYEFISNEIISGLTSGIGTAVYLVSGINNALIIGNKFYATTSHVLTNAINTSLASNSKIISNVCLNGGITSAAGDVLNGNIVI